MTAVHESSDNAVPSDLTQVMYCSIEPVAVPLFNDDISGPRLESLTVTAAKWANNTVLHYYFFDNPATDGSNVQFSDGSTRFVTWVGDDIQRGLVRAAFDQWKAAGIGLSFVETTDRHEAEIRIGFMQGNGSWSYVGTDVLRHGPNERTMNFGWDIRTDNNVARHEIGHTLGMPHEHQNPFSGIMWNEDAVYASLGGPPNNWPRDKTFFNILRKLNTGEVTGSTWDPDSIMHYPFAAGLIRSPAPFDQGLRPRGGLSPNDLAWVKRFYPASAPFRSLALSQSERLGLASGEQADFLFSATRTRQYTVQTVGVADTQIVVFEEVGGAWRFFDEDDDSGTAANARLRVRLRKGRRYAIRVRMRFNDTSTEPSLIIS